MFSIKINNFYLIKLYLKNFLEQRGFDLSSGFVKFSVFSRFKGLNIMGCIYKDFCYYSLSCKFSRNNIKNQKAKLKLLIKDFSDLPTINLVNNLNVLIYNWSNVYSFCESFYYTCNELDVYLHRLLWRWAKRRHPRRKSIWLYSKYWKYFLGRWKFFAVDVLTKQIMFLNSHNFLAKENLSLPYSLNVFDYLDKKKKEKFCFEKLPLSIRGIFRFLWIQQKGACLICKKTFVHTEFVNIKICNINKRVNFLKNLALIHKYCV